MSEEFRIFLSNLPARRGYCLNCLSHMYEEPAVTIKAYLSVAGIERRSNAECRNCGERGETYRSGSSS